MNIDKVRGVELLEGKKFLVAKIYSCKVYVKKIGCNFVRSKHFKNVFNINTLMFLRLVYCLFRTILFVEGCLGNNKKDKETNM